MVKVPVYRGEDCCRPVVFGAEVSLEWRTGVSCTNMVFVACCDGIVAEVELRFVAG